MDKYGLIGYPLSHSFSMEYFNDKFKSEFINAKYVNFEISNIKEIKNIIDSEPQLKGLNVTIPYKERVIPYLDKLSENAKLIGAVNVIKIERSRRGKIRLTGFNSDIIGFKESIAPLLFPRHKSALILGTGGAAKAVYFGLKQLGLTAVYVSRKKSDENFLTYEELTPEIMDQHKLIVNCTPVGMYPDVDAYPPIPYEHVTNRHFLYDLLYNPQETMFMKLGKKQGATTKNGLEMLLLQAFAGWQFWNPNV
ncbi:MAG: shikimate dehydrogenase [Candidatus Symbiothrix sp.]|nr:shikimate dehydrogenase [Candidatus Symbiothrix sp.]